MFYDVDELYHDGQPRRSGRYKYGTGAKWGKPKNDPGPGQRAKVKRTKEDKQSKKEEKKQAKIDESRRRKDESREDFRKRIRGSDDAGQIYKNTTYFTDEELKQIAQRMQSIADIKKFSPEKVNKVKNFFSHLDNVANYVGTATKLYTNVMKAVNVVSGDSNGNNNNKKNKK